MGNHNRPTSVLHLPGGGSGSRHGGGQEPHHHRHYRVRWRSRGHSSRRRLLMLSCLGILFALMCYWSLLRACHRVGTQTSDLTPAVPAQLA